MLIPTISSMIPFFNVCVAECQVEPFNSLLEKSQGQ